MAKIYGINGKITGKVGNTVFAVDGGVQVARQYNPIVANPRTPAQVVQRQKVDFAGQLSSGIVPAALEGLAGNKRQRRSALLSNLIKDAVSVKSSSQGNVITFNAPKLVLSNGDVEMPNAEYTLTKQTSGTFGLVPSVTLTPVTGQTELPKSGRIRVVFIAVPKTNEALGGDVFSQVVDAELVGGETMGVTGIMTLPNEVSVYSVTAYVIPLELVNEGALATGYVSALVADDQFVLPATMQTNGAYKYGRSAWIDTI